MKGPLMHAFILEHYGPDGLVPGLVSEPLPAPDEVVVRLEAIAINTIDWKVRNGWLAQMLPMRLPIILGYEGAGHVLAAGENVTAFAAGDRVAGFFDSGAYAEIATTSQDRIVAIPPTLSYVHAAALPTAAETSAHMQDLLRPTPAATILINGAAGGVGSILTQSLIRGGHRVIGTASRTNHDYLRTIGAEPISHGATMRDEMRRISPTGFDVAYDVTGFEFIDAVADDIDAQGIVTTTDYAAVADGAIVVGGSSFDMAPGGATKAALNSAARGELHVEIAATYPFRELPDALAFNEQGHLRGKVIVTDGK